MFQCEFLLVDDFGYDHILWIFSGRRGIHCWVCDKAARTLGQNIRNGILNYIGRKPLKCFLEEDHFQIRKLNYYDRLTLVISLIYPPFNNAFKRK